MRQDSDEGEDSSCPKILFWVSSQVSFEDVVANEIDELLRKLERLVREGGDEPIEGDIYELKSVPSDGGSWH